MTPKTRTLLPIATAALFALTSCAGDGQPVPTVTVTEEAAPAPEEVREEPNEETPKPAQTNARGHVEKQVGEWIHEYQEITGEPTVDFRITEIERDFQCDAEFADASENGEFVRFEFEVVKHPALKEYGQAFYIMLPDLMAYQADGSQVLDPQANAIYCLAGEDSMAIALHETENATGNLVLDLPKDATAVALDSLQTSAIWEWQLQAGDGA